MSHNGNARVKQRVKGQTSASRSIMLYTPNLHSAACQLYLNKTEGEKKTLAVGQLGGNHQDEFDKF